MNKLRLASTSLSSARPLELIDAATRAGYDGFGMRLFRSPGKRLGRDVAPSDRPSDSSLRSE